LDSLNKQGGTQVRVHWFVLALLLVAFLAGPVRSQVGPTNPKVAIQKGNELVAKGRFEEAIRKYENVGTNDGDSYAIALYNTGVCYYELWQVTRSISFYELAIKVRKGLYPKASYALGVALEDLGRRQEAKAAYEQALLASQSDHPLANYRLGLFAARTGDLQSAAAFFRKAVNRPGDHVPASHNNLGVMLARMRRFQEAEKEFVVALKDAGGTYPDAAHNLSLCRRVLANTNEKTTFALRISNMKPVN
jgi:tetratricopeptide (TPR) repeat protein